MNPLIHQWRQQAQRAIMAALSLSRTEFLDAAIAEAVLRSMIRESRQC